MEDYEFVPSELATKEGKVTIFLANTDDGVLSDGGRPDDEIHDFYIASEDGFPLAKSPRLDPGTTGAFTIEGMRPGKYPFVCTLHAATQMRGTIEVTA